MYIIIFDSEALKQERIYFQCFGSKLKTILEKFPHLTEIKEEEIEEILLCSRFKKDGDLVVRYTDCRGFILEPEKLRINYGSLHEYGENNASVMKRVWKYIFNKGLKEKDSQEELPLILLVENIGEYNFIKNPSIVEDPSFMGDIEALKKARDWKGIVAKFPIQEEIVKTGFWWDTYCLNELYFALSKLCEASARRVSEIEKKKYEEFFFYVVERCIELQPNVFMHKSVLAYHYYNVFTKNKVLADGGYKRALELYEELSQNSPENYKEKYRYAKIRQYHFEAYSWDDPDWFQTLSTLINDYRILIDEYALLPEDKQKKNKKEFVKSLYAYSVLSIDNLFFNWEKYSSNLINAQPHKSYFFETERLEKMCVVEGYLKKIIEIEHYESGSFKLSDHPNYLDILYRLAQLEQEKGLVYVARGKMEDSQSFFKKSNEIVKQVFALAYDRREKGEKFNFPYHVKLTKAVNLYFLGAYEQCHKCFNNAEPYMLYEEGVMYYLSGEKQFALDVLGRIPEGNMCYEKSQKLIERIAYEMQ